MTKSPRPCRKRKRKFSHSLATLCFHLNSIAGVFPALAKGKGNRKFGTGNFRASAAYAKAAERRSIMKRHLNIRRVAEFLCLVSQIVVLFRAGLVAHRAADKKNF